ncbi:MAG TPA: lysylphosphatidylglycerol synthase transmembrane domain-containing protein [Anaerolineaceae bacterium]|nr:lysylphosphatidylglycerol synthase transmembrane domain-containing protein [Anaerolineaceae bacterium]
MKIKRWQIYLGVLISAVFLFLAFRKVDFAMVWFHLKSAKWVWVVLGLVLYFLGVIVRAWRWKILLNPLKSISVKKLFPVVCVGYMGNNIYPARAGEFLRAFILKQKDDVSFSGSLASIVVERLFDGITILALVLFNLGRLVRLITDPVMSRNIQLATWVVSAVFGVLLIVFLLMAIFPQKARTVASWLTQHLLPKKWRAKADGIIDKFIEGVSVLRSWHQVLLVLALSFLVWVLEAGLYFGVMKALGLNLAFIDLLLVEGVVNLVLLVPAMPGGLGTFDAATKFMLELFQQGAEQALGFALILRVALWLPITALGAFYFVKEGFSLSTDIGQLKTDYQEETPVGPENEPSLVTEETKEQDEHNGK